MRGEGINSRLRAERNGAAGVGAAPVGTPHIGAWEAGTCPCMVHIRTAQGSSMAEGTARIPLRNPWTVHARAQMTDSCRPAERPPLRAPQAGGGT